MNPLETSVRFMVNNGRISKAESISEAILKVGVIAIGPGVASYGDFNSCDGVSIDFGRWSFNLCASST